MINGRIFQFIGQAAVQGSLVVLLAGCVSQQTESAVVDVDEVAAVREFREVVEPQAIYEAEQGAYKVKLRLLGEDWMRLDGVNYILMEDGVPLKYLESTSLDTVQNGKGLYGFAAGKELIFSPSDNSDPRKNNREYEVVWNEKVVSSTAMVNAKKTFSIFSVNVPSDLEVVPYRLSWKNLDNQVTVTPRLKHKGGPSLDSFQGMLESVVSEEMSDEEKIIALWNFVVKWRYHYYPSEENGHEPHDPVKLINVYGYGYCDDSASVLSLLARALGFMSRTYGLDGHVVSEIYYDGAWHMFDPDMEVFYRGPEGNVASVEYLEINSDLVLFGPELAVDTPRAYVANLYSTAGNNFILTPDKLISDILKYNKVHEIDWFLSPDDEVDFFFIGNSAYRTDYIHKPLPPIVGTGRVVRKLSSLNVELNSWGLSVVEDWPYPVLKSELVLGSGFAKGDINAQVFDRSLRKLSPLPVVSEAGVVKVGLDRWLTGRQGATYGFQVLLEGVPQEQAGLVSGKLSSIFQFAPRAIPHVSAGENLFELKLEFPNQGGIPEAWKGVEMTMEWLRQDVEVSN